MGWLGPKSSSLRRALHTHFLFSSSKFSGVFSESLSLLTDPITANVGCVIGQSPSQKPQEFHRPASASIARLLDVGPAFCTVFDATSSKGVASLSKRIHQRLICVGTRTCNRTSSSRGRVRGLNQGMQLKRGFSSTIVKEVEAKKCWSCEETSTAAPFFVCSSCKAIQPLDHSMDFFQLLSVDTSYLQDSKILEKNYKQLQKFLHPDLSSGKSEREQDYSAEQSAQVIKAYYVLLDPLSRARYMLKLNGVDIDEEVTIHDPALLMEILFFGDLR
ncbi:iron-sulfur cluster co-chaperone protein HscB homolog isoform X2 [Physcomitrium patens]|uniref:J domain-containing protein n=1 Tax=Physcomitrium patens TaxID=3218 RepID=A0A7I4BB02_PHYPA|nr:uncharacterized protein LOC112293288 isoform X2 [Physcomitrium patens]|eukprot:XP_024398310.1 uncharacterized protein LOC112293288 isoform X2 [Physcomitrella patens]